MRQESGVSQPCATQIRGRGRGRNPCAGPRIDAMSQESFKSPEPTDFHGRKRELLRMGREQGRLTWEEIYRALPTEFLGDTELEVFLFTCRNMGIEVEPRP